MNIMYLITVHSKDKAITLSTHVCRFPKKTIKQYDTPACLPLQYACTEIEASLVFTNSLRVINILKRP